jgi:hypothetical protein
MSDLLLLIRVQARVATFLAGLTLDRLVALAEGRMGLAVVDEPSETSPRQFASPTAAPVQATRLRSATAAEPSTSRTRRPTGDAFDPVATAARLRNCATLDEGTELLAALNLKADGLRALAKALKIPSSGTKTELAKKILALTLSGRTKHAGLRQG